MLKDLIMQARVDPESMLMLLEKFKPLILKYAVLLHYPEAKQDLDYELIILAHKMRLENIQDYEGAVVNYIAESIYHAFLKLYKLQERHKSTVEYNSDLENAAVLTPDPFTEPDFWIQIKQALSELEYETVILAIVYEYSDAEISRMRRVSRQTVNDTRKRALEKLRRMNLMD